MVFIDDSASQRGYGPGTCASHAVFVRDFIIRHKNYSFSANYFFINKYRTRFFNCKGPRTLWLIFIRPSFAIFSVEKVLSSFNDPRLYKMATVFMMAYPYGTTRLMSSYYWPKKMVNGTDVNSWMGPPTSVDMSTLSVFEGDSSECKNGWASTELILHAIVYDNYVKFLIGKWDVGICTHQSLTSLNNLSKEQF